MLQNLGAEDGVKALAGERQPADVSHDIGAFETRPLHSAPRDIDADVRRDGLPEDAGIWLLSAARIEQATAH
jgi:hypothetical protein